MSELLLKAVRKGEYQTVKSLIGRQDVNLSYRDKFNSDALFYSIVYPNIDIFNLIVSSEGVDFSKTYDESKNILHIAVESDLEDRDFFNIITALCEKTVNINGEDKYGNTPLWYACIRYRVNQKTIDLFLKKGADINIVNKFGSSVFLSAKKHEREELLQILNSASGDHASK